MDSSSTNPLGESFLSPELKEAIQAFEQAVFMEKELAAEPIFVGHLSDHVKGTVLRYLLEGRSDSEIIEYLNEAGRSFKQYRRDQHPSSNPIRVYRKDHL